MSIYFKALLNKPTLTKLLSYFFRDTQRAIGRIKSLVSTLDDFAIVRTLSKELGGFIEEKRDIRPKVELRSKIIKDLSDKKEFKFLDYGAGSGEIDAAFVAKNPGASGFIVDVPEWHGHVNLEAAKGVTALRSVHPESTGPLLLDIPAGSIDFIFIEFVLHHIPLAERIRIYRLFLRILSIDGVIIVRDHDITSPDDRAYVEVEHILYSVKEGQTKLPYEDYRSRKEWINEWTQWGFVPVKESETMTVYGANRSFTTFLKRRPVTGIDVNELVGTVPKVVLAGGFATLIDRFKDSAPALEFSTDTSLLENAWVITDHWDPRFVSAVGMWSLMIAPERHPELTEHLADSGMWIYTNKIVNLPKLLHRYLSERASRYLTPQAMEVWRGLYGETLPADPTFMAIQPSIDSQISFLISQGRIRVESIPWQIIEGVWRLRGPMTDIWRIIGSE